MNLFLDYQKKFIAVLKKLKKNNVILLPKDLKSFAVDLPPKNQDADMSFNGAMILAKINKRSPLELAEVIKGSFSKKFKEFEIISIAKPGFINISFKKDFWNNHLLKIVKLGPKYGSNKLTKKKYNIEFVSANPTGPLHVGHCRGAILGDVLANLLKFNGNKVVKEYYVNDYGSQIKNFVLSVYGRILEKLKNIDFPNDENLYPGDYIKDIAKEIIQSKKFKNFDNYELIYKKLADESLKLSIKIIKKDLSTLGIVHDNFVYESQLIKSNFVSKTINKLTKEKYIFKGNLKAPKGEITKNWIDREQLLFRSTLFGDDVDRPLQKVDLSWTYFASDIAYHANKVKRNFDFLINILGADHSGYTKRIKSAVSAVSKNKINLICKVSQLVKLLKNGEPFKMSKRKGNYITLKDLVNEVGKDSVRFMMLNRSNDVELDFDFEKVTEKSKDNPVFYVQYAYVRINSIFRALNLKIENKITFLDKNFTLNKYEIEILKKISEWPNCINNSSLKLEPHRIPFYLYDLATLFHSYWSLGNENQEFRFISDGKKLNKNRLLLLQTFSLVIKNGMSILGVSLPKRM
jgi:arginyl-tRNA synthetase